MCWLKGIGYDLKWGALRALGYGPVEICGKCIAGTGTPGAQPLNQESAQGVICEKLKVAEQWGWR